MKKHKVISFTVIVLALMVGTVHGFGQSEVIQVVAIESDSVRVELAHRNSNESMTSRWYKPISLVGADSFRLDQIKLRIASSSDPLIHETYIPCGCKVFTVYEFLTHLGNSAYRYRCVDEIVIDY